MSDGENSDRMALAVAAHVVADQSALFAFLADPHNHGGAPVERIDTHGAVVFLAGETAYKVKRAVEFPYMNFSTPEKRSAALRHEIEVNRQNAPEIYRDVVPVTRETDGRLAIGGDGETVDWVLRMSRFNPENTLDKLAEREGLSSRLLIDLAEAIATAHAAAVHRVAGPWIEDLTRYVVHNEAAFLAAPTVFPAARVHELTAVSNAHLARLAPLAEARGRQGLVRLCHGDCHLGNIVLIDGRPVLFDAIEFDDRIATCDVLYDLAFLLMDLWERDMAEGANLVFNRYLHLTRREADLEALTALPFYMSLRAAIRAMALSAKAANLETAARNEAEAEALRYFETAEMFLEPLDPGLIAIGGLSGSGKS
ncbi:MAG: phosphotransferase, partial [Hyphomicrobiales bacterium]|nr:phosphotransferase [Hyphomicrobiales bacterium]